MECPLRWNLPDSKQGHWHTHCNRPLHTEPERECREEKCHRGRKSDLFESIRELPEDLPVFRENSVNSSSETAAPFFLGRVSSFEHLQVLLGFRKICNTSVGHGQMQNRARIFGVRGEVHAQQTDISLCFFSFNAPSAYPKCSIRKGCWQISYPSC